MLTGYTESVSELHLSRDQPLRIPDSDTDDEGTAYLSDQILYIASFEELARSIIQYDTIIWVSISLLLVLAWGVGVLMLLYLPIRRYMLQKDISSRELYVTPSEIIYKISRPSYIPFCSTVKFKKCVPLACVIDITVEQGCLQSKFGIHTFRVEYVSHGKSAPVDELQVQGVCDPGFLRKVIIREASKIARKDRVAHMTYTEGQASSRSPSRNLKMQGSPHHPSLERRGVVTGELLLNRIEEMNKSVKKIEQVIEKSQGSSQSS